MLSTVGVQTDYRLHRLSMNNCAQSCAFTSARLCALQVKSLLCRIPKLNDFPCFWIIYGQNVGELLSLMFSYFSLIKEAEHRPYKTCNFVCIFVDFKKKWWSPPVANLINAFPHRV